MKCHGDTHGMPGGYSWSAMGIPMEATGILMEGHRDTHGSQGDTHGGP